MRRLGGVFLATLLIGASAQALDFGVKGYYRFRGDLTHDLDTQTHNTAISHDNDRFGVIQYNQMRFRLSPHLKINDNLSVHTEFDILDNVLFGQSANKNLQILSPVTGTITLPSGAGTVGEVGGAAGENGSIHVRRAWMEILAPFGKFKIGRQPSHWGLGIFQNDGDDPNSDFGDNQDRVAYLGQLQYTDGSALSLGAVWDIPFEAQNDPRIQGLGGAIRDNGQDTKQFSGLAYYDRTNFSFGTLAGVRMRSGSNGTTTTAVDAKGNTVSAGNDGDTMMYFGDLYAKYAVDVYTFQFEGVFIGGEITTGVAIDAIPFSSFSSSGSGAGIISLPARQDLQVMMAALEASATYDWGGEVDVKAGFAGGDETPLSTKITQYGFRPDYKIALMMFHRPVGTSPSLFGATASNTGTTSKLTGGVPITGNFINNALYLSTGYKHKINVSKIMPQANWLKVGGNITTAWAPKKNVNLDFGALLGNTTLPVVKDSNSTIFKRWYGVELDAIAEAQFYENLYTAFEAGVLIPGKAYNIDINSTGLDPGDIIDPIPADRASIAIAARLTAQISF